MTSSQSGIFPFITETGRLLRARPRVITSSLGQGDGHLHPLCKRLLVVPQRGRFANHRLPCTCKPVSRALLPGAGQEPLRGRFPTRVCGQPREKATRGGFGKTRFVSRIPPALPGRCLPFKVPRVLLFRARADLAFLPATTPPDCHRKPQSHGFYPPCPLLRPSDYLSPAPPLPLLEPKCPKDQDYPLHLSVSYSS